MERIRMHSYGAVGCAWMHEELAQSSVLRGQAGSALAAERNGAAAADIRKWGVSRSGNYGAGATASTNDGVLEVF